MFFRGPTNTVVQHLQAPQHHPTVAALGLFGSTREKLSGLRVDGTICNCRFIWTPIPPSSKRHLEGPRVPSNLRNHRCFYRCLGPSMPLLFELATLRSHLAHPQRLLVRSTAGHWAGLGWFRERKTWTKETKFLTVPVVGFLGIDRWKSQKRAREPTRCTPMRFCTLGKTVNSDLASCGRSWPEVGFFRSPLHTHR